MKEFNNKDFNKNKAPAVMAIVSGKGGVGKTFVAINLASALHRQGKQTLLLDADFGLGNIHLLLGEKADINLDMVLSGQHKIDDALIPTAEGFSIIPGERGKPLMANLSFFQLSGLISAIDSLETKPDVFLIDTAGSVSNEELQLVAAAEEIIVVITPDLLSLQDAAEYIRQINIHHGLQRFFIISNMTKNQREAQNLMEKLQNLVGFDVDVVLKPLGYLPKDDSVIRSVESMSSTLESEPESKVAKLVTTIADKLKKEDLNNNKHGGLSFFYENKIKSGDV